MGKDRPGAPPRVFSGPWCPGALQAAKLLRGLAQVTYSCCTCSWRMAPAQHEDAHFCLSHPVVLQAQLCGVGHLQRWMTYFLSGFCVTVVFMAGVRASEEHPMIWGNYPAQCKAGKCQHLPDGAGRKQALVEPDGDAKSEGNELLLALGHFAPVSRGARPLCHSRAEDCFLCHLWG